MEERINCKTCGTSILLQTAERNEGLCRPCYHQAKGGKPVKQVTAAAAGKRLEKHAGRKFGFVCDQCQTVEIGGWRSLDNRKCRCEGELRQVELIEVANKPRLAYLGIWLGFAAICFGLWAALRTMGNWAGLFLALAIFGAFIVFAYVFMAAVFFGWRWITRKDEIASPPSWYPSLTFGRAWLRESALSAGILVLFFVVSLILWLING